MLTNCLRNKPNATELQQVPACPCLLRHSNPFIDITQMPPKAPKPCIGELQGNSEPAIGRWSFARLAVSGLVTWAIGVESGKLGRGARHDHLLFHHVSRTLGIQSKCCSQSSSVPKSPQFGSKHVKTGQGIPNPPAPQSIHPRPTLAQFLPSHPKQPAFESIPSSSLGRDSVRVQALRH